MFRTDIAIIVSVCVGLVLLWVAGLLYAQKLIDDRPPLGPRARIQLDPNDYW